MTPAQPAPTFDGTFPHNWTAEILPRRPMILPGRQFVYPAIAEEVERGALEVLVQPQRGERFLATCALGFRDAATPSGIWALPNPDWLCAVSGGYAYLIDVNHPEQFTFLRYRPVLNVMHHSANFSGLQQKNHQGLLLFVGQHSILAWGQDGEAWESDRLSWEGVTVSRIEGNVLYGKGWDLLTDKDMPFTLDLETGRKVDERI